MGVNRAREGDTPMRTLLAAIGLVALALAPSPALAQAADYRVDQLQEEVRRLNGRVEELSFQLLQMEERMRKMQEDNEFRFQELEDKADGAARDGGGGGDGAEGSDRLGKSSGASDAPPDAPANASNAPASDTAANDAAADGFVTGPRPAAPAADAPPTPPAPPATAPPARAEASDRATLPAPNRGAPPRRLGTLTFDPDGNLVAGGPTGGPRLDEEPLPEPGEAGSPFRTADEATDAAAEYGPTPAAVFARAKTFYENRDFAGAERAFRAHLAAWPKDPRGPAVRHYLGQSLFWQRKYYDAASVLLDTHNAHPRARTAPDTLLALGLSLAGLDQREVACATYAEVLKQYPDAAPRLGARVKAEQEAASC